MPNSAAKRVIDAYLTQKNPGYALLVDAPWGSGKTYTIKQVTNCDLDPTRLYVTLYDVHSLKAFDWALVRAINPWSNESKASWGQRAKELASGVQVFGCSVNLTKVNLTEIALRSLPDTLIFDDLERCGLRHAQLSGLINRFVEHQNKRVILILNSVGLRDKSVFDSTREKLIGRTIMLRADLNATIAASWAQIRDGRGHKALRTRQELVEKTFEEAGHQNLRLLLRSMRDAASMLDSLPPHFLEFDEAVDYLTSTFLALHMAYHGGHIGKDDMLNRARISRSIISRVNGKRDAKLDPLEKLQKAHPNCNIEAGYNDILPIQLGYSLIVDGYASPHDINKLLLSTHYFSSQTDQPYWVRLWKWDSESEADLEMVLETIDKQQIALEIVEPGEILQIHGAKSFLNSLQSKPDLKKISREYYDYIKTLGRANKIRAASPANGDQRNYGFDWSGGTISYGGFGFEPDRRARFLAKVLQAEMEEAFERSIPAICEDLLRKLRAQPIEFVAEFEYINKERNFSNVPILHRLSYKEVAAALLLHFDEQRDMARLIASVFAKRRSTNRHDLKIERRWVERLEKNLIENALKRSDLYVAQVRLFIQRNLKAT